MTRDKDFACKLRCMHLFCAPLDGRPSATNFATRTSSLPRSRIFNTSHERGCYRALVKRGVHKRGLNTGRRMGFNGVVPFISREICLISLGPCSPIMFAETNSWVIHVSRRGELARPPNYDDSEILSLFINFSSARS